VTIVLKSGSLNLLEPPEPVQACNGIALPLNTVAGKIYNTEFAIASLHEPRNNYCDK